MRNPHPGPLPSDGRGKVLGALAIISLVAFGVNAQVTVTTVATATNGLNEPYNVVVDAGNKNLTMWSWTPATTCIFPTAPTTESSG